MRHGLKWALLAALAGAVGCKSSGTRKNGPQDPLLMSKPPAKSKFGDAGANASARAEPVPPAVPAGAWAAGPPKPVSSVRLGAPDFGPPATALKPVPVVTSVSDRPHVAAGQEASAEPYARAADSRWLQGVLEQTADERWLLRYEPLSRDETGGKVLLEGHPGFELYHPGDVVRVEGKLLGEAAAQPGSHPRYRVQHVRLVRRKEE